MGLPSKRGLLTTYWLGWSSKWVTKLCSSTTQFPDRKGRNHQGRPENTETSDARNGWRHEGIWPSYVAYTDGTYLRTIGLSGALIYCISNYDFVSRDHPHLKNLLVLDSAWNCGMVTMDYMPLCHPRCWWFWVDTSMKSIYHVSRSLKVVLPGGFEINISRIKLTQLSTYKTNWSHFVPEISATLLCWKRFRSTTATLQPWMLWATRLNFLLLSGPSTSVLSFPKNHGGPAARPIKNQSI